MSRDSELDQNLSADLRKKFSSDLDEIWYLGRGRRVMHDGIRMAGSKVKVKVTSLFKDQGSKISNQGKSTVTPPRD